MAKLERTISNQLKPLINRQYMDAATLITQGVTDVDHVVNEQTTRLRKILRVHYRRVAFTAGRQATLNFDPAKSMNESFWNDINQYIALNTGRKIQLIQGNTVNSITRVVKKGIEAGETNREIATRLRGKGRIDSRFKALRIARTETLGMYNSATDASVRETGIKFTRVWSTTKDLRTRRKKGKNIYDHWDVDGDTAAQNEDFDVSGEKLSFPGDPKGSAGNIINCRCVLLYERDRSAQQVRPAPDKPISGFVPSGDIVENSGKTWVTGGDLASVEKNFKSSFGMSLKKLDYDDAEEFRTRADKIGAHLGSMVDRHPKIKELLQKKKNGEFIVSNSDAVAYFDHKVVAAPEMSGNPGFFIPNKGTVAVSGKGKWLKPKDVDIGSVYNVEQGLKGVIRHEVGHKVDDILFLEDRMVWDEIYRSKSKDWWGKNISYYAEVDASEAFAESFTAYTNVRYKAGTLPKEIEKFFDKNIGRKK